MAKQKLPETSFFYGLAMQRSNELKAQLAIDPPSESVPCKFCTQPTPMTATRLCNNCWEVTRRLEDFLRLPRGQKLALELLAKHFVVKP